MGLKPKESLVLVKQVLVISQVVLGQKPKSSVIKIVNFIKEPSSKFIMFHLFGFLVALSLIKLVSLRYSNSLRRSDS